MATSPHGYTDDFGPNVANILSHGSRIIRGPVPSRVRKDLNAAVKAGVLGHFKKDGLKPEIFFHPDHRNGAIEQRQREVGYAVKCIAGVVGFNPAMRDLPQLEDGVSQ